MRKSIAKDLLCPTCNQSTLILAGKTTPDKKTGKFYQRYRCLNPQCTMTITTRPVNNEVKTVELPKDSEVVVVKRDNKGRFVKKNV